MKTRSKNKAIKGRRNRCHALGPIITYSPFDMAAKAELDKILRNMGNTGWKLAAIPNHYTVINAITYKRPRFL